MSNFDFSHILYGNAINDSEKKNTKSKRRLLEIKREANKKEIELINKSKLRM